MPWGRLEWRRFITGLFLSFCLPGAPSEAADCNENGLDDLEEVRAGAVPDCNENGVPDGCDLEPVNPVLEPSQDLPSEELGVPLRMSFADLIPGGGLDLLALSHSSWPPAIEVIENDGTGAFATAGSFPLEFEPESHAVGDLDGDGDLDIALSYLAPLYATLHLNRGEGAFPDGVALPIDEEERAIAMADLDGNGALDLVLGHEGLITLLNGGGGEFTRSDFFEDEWFRALTSGDIDGDGDADIIALARSGLLLLVNDGAGHLAAIPVAAANSASDPAVEDLDGDGDLDIALSRPREVLVLWNLGGFELDRTLHGRSLAPEFIADGTNPSVIAPADLDGDGLRDLLVLCAGGSYTGAISCLRNLGGSAFSRGTIISGATELTPPTMAAAEWPPGEVLCAASGWNEARIAILEEAAGIYSLDCNLNSVPDECDVAIFDSPDCDRDGVPDSCQSLTDCDGSGSADRCDIATGLVSDCNGNGVPDSCDLDGGTSIDQGGDGIPDECQHGFSDLFVLGFECPERLQGAPGEVKTLDIFPTLAVHENAGVEAPEGWSVSIVVEGAEVESVTVDGIEVLTVLDHDDDPLTPPLGPHALDLGQAWFKTAQLGEASPGSSAPPDAKGIVSAVVVDPAILLPGAVHRAARMTLRAAIPADGTPSTIRLRYQDGLRGTRHPRGYQNAITSDGDSYRCRMEDCAFETLAVEAFLRCDANDDLRLDISDPVWILNELFDSAGNSSRTKCPLAADCNGDGGKDISDPIFALNFLFLGGRAPPAPFPSCGTGDDEGSCEPETTACP